MGVETKQFPYLEEFDVIADNNTFLVANELNNLKDEMNELGDPIVVERLCFVVLGFRLDLMMPKIPENLIL